MKVLLVNGSPNLKGCTYTALQEIAEVLHGEGIETEIFQLGKEPIRGCVGCNGCRKLGGECVYKDLVNTFLDKAKESDGFVFGSPVYYAAASGQITSFLDRVFYAGSSALEYKPGASIVSCRRAGSTATLDQLNKYFTINSMPIVSSHYWNMVHGNTPEEVKEDLEGMQIMRAIGHNMAWLLKVIELGKASGVTRPLPEQRIMTNFIR